MEKLIEEIATMFVARRYDSLTELERRIADILLADGRLFREAASGALYF